MRLLYGLLMTTCLPLATFSIYNSLCFVATLGQLLSGVVQNTLGLKTIYSSSTCLLHETIRWRVLHNVPHLGEIDSHTQSTCCDHHPPQAILFKVVFDLTLLLSHVIAWYTLMRLQFSGFQSQQMLFPAMSLTNTVTEHKGNVIKNPKQQT